MSEDLAKSVVLFILNTPVNTKKDAMELYMEWQEAGGRVTDPDVLLYILFYFDKMKNYDRNIIKEIAIMDGFIKV